MTRIAPKFYSKRIGDVSTCIELNILEQDAKQQITDKTHFLHKPYLSVKKMVKENSETDYGCHDNHSYCQRVLHVHTIVLV